MRALVVGAGFFLLALAVPIPASAAIGGNVNAPIDCAHTKFQDELAICADPALARSYEDVRHAYLEDVARFTGSDRKVFIAGEHYWRASYGGCFDRGADGKYPTKAQTIRCLGQGLAQRLDFLRAIKADPSRLKASVAQYDAVELWYVKKFAKEYEGKHVDVWGWSQTTGCEHETVSVPHTIRLKDGGISIPIRFKSLQDIDISFLCGKRPGGWWPSTVILDRSGLSLYATQLMTW